MSGNNIKGFYFSQVESSSTGPKNKIMNQIEAFNKSGIELELVENPFELEGLVRGNFILRQIVSRLPFTYVYSRHKYCAHYKKADVYYIRFLAGDRYFVSFLKKLRKNNPNAVIIMELADYPTTWYMTTSLFYRIIYFPIMIKDYLARYHYRKYVDRIAILKPIDKVFGIETLKFENGIDVSNIKKRVPCGINTINMVAVAAMCNFHGYDRLIEGIKNYRDSGGNRKIIVHMVGGKDAPGNELNKYISLVKEYKLEKYFVFYGTKRGAELDEIYDKCNIAVASLGMSRIGYKTANSLKVREYLAKGLPIITGCNIDLFENHSFKYECKFSNDESSIDIKKIIDFFDNTYLTNNEQFIIDDIREYSEEYCDMSYAMNNVINFIKNNNKRG